MNRKPIKAKIEAIRRFSPHCKTLVSNFWWFYSKSEIAAGALSKQPSLKGQMWNPTVIISMQGKSDPNFIFWLGQMQIAEFLCIQNILWMRFYFNLVTKMLTFWAMFRIIITCFNQWSVAFAQQGHLLIIPHSAPVKEPLGRNCEPVSVSPPSQLLEQTVAGVNSHLTAIP